MPAGHTARIAVALALLLGGLGFIGWSLSADDSVTPFSDAPAEQPPAPWHVHPFPGGRKPLTRFDVVMLDGQRVLRVAADQSYGTLRHDLPGLQLARGTMLVWRWRLDKPLREADLQRRGGDDTPIRVCALFDLELNRLGFVERNLLLAARRVSNQYLPAETLCYVWDQRLPAGSELPNPFSRRLRYVVLNSGDGQLGAWVTHERDLAADFLRVFGDETDGVPPLVGLLIGADADNTGGSSLAYVGDIRLRPPGR